MKKMVIFYLLLKYAHDVYKKSKLGLRKTERKVRKKQKTSKIRKLKNKPRKPMKKTKKRKPRNIMKK